MRFPHPLRRATLLKRYKRFLSDHRLDDGGTVTAHVANPGAMTGLVGRGARNLALARREPEAQAPL